MTKHSIRKSIVFFATIILWSTHNIGLAQSSSTELPLWEFGLIGGLFTTPQYVGSNQRYTLPIGLPYLIYRGDIFKSDRNGVRGELLKRNAFSLDIGLGFGLPVKNNNHARQDMPDLSLTGQIGPRLNWQISEPDDDVQLSLHLPIRYVLDIHNTNLGWIAEPYFKIEQKNIGTDGKYSARLDAGLLFAGHRYHSYYYDVSDQFATTNRPAYTATSGLSNYFMNLSASYQISNSLKLSSILRWKTLSSSTIKDSPLVKDNHYLVFGLGITKTIKVAQ